MVIPRGTLVILDEEKNAFYVVPHQDHPCLQEQLVQNGYEYLNKGT